MSFRNYIGSLRKWLKSGECSKFVLGNSGADYDSVIGALVYAFYMTTSFKVLYLPLIDCQEADLSLRFEITTVLDSLAITPNQLLYTSMLKPLNTPNKTFALYDHNTRPEIPASQIEQIIDHHAYNPASIKCNHIIHHCGSALTLLYYLYRPGLLGKFSGTELEGKYRGYFQRCGGIGGVEGKGVQIQEESRSTIEQLLYYGILIDTYGLNPNQAQVWTEFDSYVIETLQPRLEPKFTFDELAATKFDTQKNLKLSLSQHLKKDYKQIKYPGFSIHYSTILLSITAFEQRYWNQLLSELQTQHMSDSQLYAFMFAFPEEGKADIAAGKFKKFILFNGKNEGLIAKLESIMGDLGFKKWEDAFGWKKWSDPTGKISRKIFDKELKARL